MGSLLFCCRFVALVVCVCLVACSGPVAHVPFVTAEPPEISVYMKTPAVLVFSGTRGWRHNEGIAGADLFFARAATERSLGLFTTENPAVFNPRDLARFDLVVFNNVTGMVLGEAQRAAFEDWMSAGGAWIGLHGAGDGSMSEWSWYQDSLIDTKFIGHTMGPQFQAATLEGLALTHPILDGLPLRWTHTDEWYSFDRVPSPSGATLLVGADESTYEPRNRIVSRWPTDLSMGSSVVDHPVIWAICQPKFRGFYSALGHSFETYDSVHYRRLLNNAVDWVMRADSEPCE